MKHRYLYGERLVECDCGVWRIDEDDIRCWNHEERKQLYIEAQAQLTQAIRNLGYNVLKSLKLLK